MYGDWHWADTIHTTDVEPAVRVTAFGEMDSEVITHELAATWFGVMNTTIQRAEETRRNESFFMIHSPSKFLAQSHPT